MREPEGLFLSYLMRFELSHAVEDALLKGVPLYFVAEAAVFRRRWYWRDARVARQRRSYKLSWQPLSRRYRINYGSLSQNEERLADALSSLQRASRWKLADAAALDGDGHYLEFSFQLDTSQLPRPLEIGVGDKTEWALAIERRVDVPELR